MNSGFFVSLFLVTCLLKYQVMRFLSFIIILGLIYSCNTSKKLSDDKSPKAYLEHHTEDSTVYELIVLDPGYETFLQSQAQPIHFYSNNYYQTWNVRYVAEWNLRHSDALRYGDFYETRINYDALEDYDIELNYRLYNYFLFIEKRYGIVLINRGRTP